MNTNLLDEAIKMHPKDRVILAEKILASIDYEDNNTLRGSQSVPLPHITTSHIISVDIDEYLNVKDIIHKTCLDLNLKPQKDFYYFCSKKSL